MSEAVTAVRTDASRPTRTVLPNGLVVLFHENHANPTVAIHGLVPAGAIFDPANEMLYPENHPYHRSPLGTEATLGAMAREDLAAFHAAHYGPAQTILVLAGDVDPESALEQVQRSFLDWKRLERPAPFEVPAAP